MQQKNGITVTLSFSIAITFLTEILQQYALLLDTITIIFFQEHQHNGKETFIHIVLQCI